MPPNEQQTRKLLGILAKENSKTGAYQRTPALFRETWGDTHKTMSAEYWGPSPDLVPTMRNRHSAGPGGGTLGRRSNSVDPSLRRSQSAGRGGGVEYRSVFRPRPEQEHVCSLARTHRDNVKGSEWALLETLEVQMYMDERQRKERQVVAVQTATRRNFDSQVRKKERERQEELRDKERERQLVLEQTAEYRESERRAAEEARARATQVKNEQIRQLQLKQTAKSKALAKKKEDELKELQQVKAQLDEEKRVAGIKVEQTRLQMQRNTRENDARMRTQAEVLAAQKLRDEELMQEGIRSLNKKEAERGEAMRALFQSAAARANRAGQTAFEERRDRLEREERLMAEAKEQKEREWQLKEARQAAKRENQKKELLDARKEHLALRDHRAAVEKAEVARLRREAEDKDAAEREADERKVRAIRERATNNRTFLTTQMGDKESKMLVDDVGMSERERELNLRLLEQAVRMVGPEPHQLSIKF